MSRPLMRESQLRRQFKTYFNEAELSAIEEKAHAAGLSVSTFIREAAIGKKIAAIPTVNAQHWGELARLAGNINQLAKRANEQRERFDAPFWDEVIVCLLTTTAAADSVRASLITQSQECSSR